MRIERVASAVEPEFDALVRIYAEALPPSECKSVDALREMIARPEYSFLAAKEEDAVVGFSIAVSFGVSPIWLRRLIAEHPLAVEKMPSNAVVRRMR